MYLLCDGLLGPFLLLLAVLLSSHMQRGAVVTLFAVYMVGNSCMWLGLVFLGVGIAQRIASY